jgi:hypothetical protein
MKPRLMTIIILAGYFVSTLLTLVGVLILKRQSVVPGLIVTIIAIAIFVATLLINEKFEVSFDELSFTLYQIRIKPHRMIAGLQQAGLEASSLSQLETFGSVGGTGLPGRA